MGTVKKILSILLVIVILSNIFSFNVIADNGEEIVHITYTGSKYHSAGCGYLRSDIAITLKEAYERKYEPCSRCNPPIYDGAVDNFNKSSNEYKVYTYTEKKPVSSQTSIQTQQIPIEPISNETLEESSTSIDLQDTSNSSHDYSLFYLLLFIFVIYVIAKIRKKHINGNNEYVSNEIETSIPNMPENVFLINGLPATKGNGKYGIYTVYWTKSGKCYHTKMNCVKSSNLKEDNFVNVYWRRSPCNRCVKRLPEITWYEEYKKIKPSYNVQMHYNKINKSN